MPALKKISLADSQSSHSDVELEWNSDSGHREDDSSSTEAEDSVEEDSEEEDEPITYVIFTMHLGSSSSFLFFSYLFSFFFLCVAHPFPFFLLCVAHPFVCRGKGKEKVKEKETSKPSQQKLESQPGGYVLLRLTPKVPEPQQTPVVVPGNSSSRYHFFLLLLFLKSGI